MQNHRLLFLLTAFAATLAAADGQEQPKAPPTSAPALLPSAIGNIVEKGTRSTPRRILLCFGKAAPGDPEAKRAFLVDQVQQVAKSFRDLPAAVSTPYEISDLLDADQVSVQKIKDRLSEYAHTLTAEDTFVMYVHGHGNPRGLLLDFTPTLAGVIGWNDLAEAILALPSRNVIVFMMTCDSGRLADVLKASEAKWRGRSHQGRNLIVLTAVSADQMAARSVDDTIGNPFTYAVRTAVSGQADGFRGGTRDGRVDMDELVQYVLAVAREKSGPREHKPQFAGEYVASDIFAQSPSQPSPVRRGEP